MDKLYEQMKILNTETLEEPKGNLIISEMKI